MKAQLLTEPLWGFLKLIFNIWEGCDKHRMLTFRDLQALFHFIWRIIAVVKNLSLGTLRKTRRQRQRERHKTKALMSKTIDVHVRYNSWYISLPSSAKQQREMTKFSVVWRTWPQPLIFPISVRNWTHSWHTQQGQVLIPTDTLDSSN